MGGKGNFLRSLSGETREQGMQKAEDEQPEDEDDLGEEEGSY